MNVGVFYHVIVAVHCIVSRTPLQIHHLERIIIALIKRVSCRL